MSDSSDTEEVEVTDQIREIICAAKCWDEQKDLQPRERFNMRRYKLKVRDRLRRLDDSEVAIEAAVNLIADFYEHSNLMPERIDHLKLPRPPLRVPPISEAVEFSYEDPTEVTMTPEPNNVNTDDYLLPVQKFLAARNAPLQTLFEQIAQHCKASGEDVITCFINLINEYKNAILNSFDLPPDQQRAFDKLSNCAADHMRDDLNKIFGHQPLTPRQSSSSDRTV
ncbi:hypothetical protein M3Y94_00930300 [Aphelenchoides besseyi]|nr:hypothetical protein M3Y94_00930300 [Aphelenchoides besseyi]